MTACASICLGAPQPDLKAGLLGVLAESDRPRSILIGRPCPVLLHLFALVQESRG